jgi:tetratricopeptide (TPR) repeat protein
LAEINPEFIERYRAEYLRNPQSRIFAPLAEAYRKIGRLDEAHRICVRGVLANPDFAGGRVVFARVLMDVKQNEEALEQLQAAAKGSPDNILAYQLMAELLLQLRRPKEALEAFKMVLFLNPNDERARESVRKWEFLQADDYEEELFEMRPSFQEPVPPPAKARALERAISMADAFTLRGDIEKALDVLTDARRQIGTNPDMENRIRILAKRAQESMVGIKAQPEASARRSRLETFLRRINERRLREPGVDPS